MYVLNYFIIAYNGHTECLKLLLKNAEAEGIVDCIDGQDRYDRVFSTSNQNAFDLSHNFI